MNVATNADRLRNGGQCNTAIKEYERALAIFEKLGDIHGAAECQHMIGVCFKMQDAIDQAVDALMKAERRYTRAGDRVGVGRVYRDLGICYGYRGEPAEALKWLSKSEATLRNEEIPAELGITQAKIGESYLSAKQYDAADEWIRRGLVTIRTQGHWFYEMTALLHLGQLLLAIDQPSEAVTTLWAAQAMIADNGGGDQHERRLAQIYGQLARGYLLLGNSSEASRLIKRTESLLTRMDSSAQRVVRRDIDLEALQSELSAA